MGKEKNIYLISFIIILAMSVIGSTYAYWVSTAYSPDKSVNTASTSYSIAMNITPLYSDFKFIPMDNQDALKALKNECRDQYDRGACNAYMIHIDGYDEKLNYISGSMDVTLNNITNLSYMMFEENSEYNEDNCVNINDKAYCIAKEATSVNDGVNLSLGDSYVVANTTEKNFILLIWLTNLEESQNATDLGDFNSIITFSMGNGGEIKGSISASIIEDNTQGDSTQSEVLE